MGVFEEINNLVSVKEIIEYYHKPLTRDNKVSCPFHNEKTPSLSVNEKDKMWKCFGCEKGGDGITFVKELKQISQIDAAKMIAQDFLKYSLQTIHHLYYMFYLSLQVD